MSGIDAHAAAFSALIRASQDYKLRKNSMMAELTSPGRSCCVQWPQPRSIMVACSRGTKCDRPAITWSIPGNDTTTSRSPAM